jgi:AraC-like DNA-binding protein
LSPQGQYLDGLGAPIAGKEAGTDTILASADRDRSELHACIAAAIVCNGRFVSALHRGGLPRGPIAMNALLESLLVPEGATWTYFYRRLDEAIPFNWHYHLEFELTLTVNSLGQRYVGDNIEPYGDTDLVLLGSNLPHTWMSQDKIDRTQPHLAHVFWIRPDWIHTLIDNLHELKAVKAMLAISNRGIVYSPHTSRAARERIDNMRTLSPAGRLVRFIEVLSILAEDQDYRLLCAPRPEHDPIRLVDRPRIDRTLEHIHKHYQSEIAIADLADLAALSVSGLHRLFKRHTRLTVGDYIAQLRIGKACSLLVSTDKPVSCIADEVGYSNLSHFNRQFLAIKELTPREFRRSYLQKEPQLPHAASDRKQAPNRLAPATAAAPAGL